MSTELGC